MVLVVWRLTPPITRLPHNFVHWHWPCRTCLVRGDRPFGPLLIQSSSSRNRAVLRRGPIKSFHSNLLPRKAVVVVVVVVIVSILTVLLLRGLGQGIDEILDLVQVHLVEHVSLGFGTIHESLVFFQVTDFITFRTVFGCIDHAHAGSHIIHHVHHDVSSSAA